MHPREKVAEWAAGDTVSGEVVLGQSETIVLHVGAFTGTSLGVEAAPLAGAAWRAVRAGAGALAIPVQANAAVAVVGEAAEAMAALHRVRFVSNAAEAADREVTITVKDR
jgi:hypothetical protein